MSRRLRQRIARRHAMKRHRREEALFDLRTARATWAWIERHGDQFIVEFFREQKLRIPATFTEYDRLLGEAVLGQATVTWPPLVLPETP